MSEAKQSKMLDEAEVVIEEAEKFLNAIGSQGEAAIAQMAERLKTTRHKLQTLEDVAVAKTKEAAAVTDEYVHENPWRAIGIAAALGAIVGMLIARK